MPEIPRLPGLSLIARAFLVLGYLPPITTLKAVYSRFSAEHRPVYVDDAVCWLEQRGFAVLGSGRIQLTELGLRATRKQQGPSYVGNRYRALLVLCRSPDGPYRYQTYWCLCDCGKVKEFGIHHLKDGSIKSCGCRFNDHKSKPPFVKHGHAKREYKHRRTRSYDRWLRLKRTSPGMVCDRWDDSFIAFHSDVGDCPRKDKVFTRIDPFGMWCPENVQWVTHRKFARLERDRRKAVANETK